MELLRFILKKFFILALVVGAVAVFFISGKENKREREIREEVKGLQAEAEKLRKSNKILKEKIAYFKTEEFQEKVAKERMNMQKEGEKVVMVNPSPSRSDEVSDKKEAPQEENHSLDEPNYLKWWNMFFGHSR